MKKSTKLKLNLRFFYILLLNFIYLGFMIWVGYKIWTKQYPVFAIIVILILLTRLPEMLTAFSRYATEDDHYSQDLSLCPSIMKNVTPENIADILDNTHVIRLIKNDLQKTGQIGYKEEWRFGLINPDRDTPNNISPLRTAVLHSSDYFKPNNIAITNGTLIPRGFNKWSYGMKTKLKSGGVH